jgi:hypothetical protein
MILHKIFKSEVKIMENISQEFYIFYYMNYLYIFII